MAIFRSYQTKTKNTKFGLFPTEGGSKNIVIYTWINLYCHKKLLWQIDMKWTTILESLEKNLWLSVSFHSQCSSFIPNQTRVRVHRPALLYRLYAFSKAPLEHKNVADFLYSDRIKRTIIYVNCKGTNCDIMQARPRANNVNRIHHATRSHPWFSKIGDELLQTMLFSSIADSNACQASLRPGQPVFSGGQYDFSACFGSHVRSNRQQKQKLENAKEILLFGLVFPR